MPGCPVWIVLVDVVLSESKFLGLDLAVALHFFLKP